MRMTSIMAAAALALTAQPSAAVGLVYDDAAFGVNVNGVEGASNNSTDNLWGVRVFSANGTLLTSADTVSAAIENAPEISQTIFGLAALTSYDVYVAYWSTQAENWAVQAGFNSGALQHFGRLGPIPTFPTSQAGTAAGSFHWDVAPMRNGVPLFVEDNRTMYLGKVGSAVATAAGEITVFIDDVAVTGGNRSAFDGLAYVPSGATVDYRAIVNRNTGNISIVNNSDTTLPIFSYSLTSAAAGLDAAAWTSIAGNFDGDDGAEYDADIWEVLVPMGEFPTSTTELTEVELPGDGGAQLAGGGTLDLGPAWIRSPYEDVQLTVRMLDGAVRPLMIEYTGAAIVPGDLDLDGDLTSGDYMALLGNLHTAAAAGMTVARSHAVGDLNGDLLINQTDFSIFRVNYDLVNGAGAFASMAANVPEPASQWLLLGSACWLLWRKRGNPGRRRAAAPFAALAALVVWGTAQCASLSAAPVTGWTLDPLAPGPSPLIDEPIAGSATIGDGTANNVDNTAFYAAIPNIALANGQQVTLSGSVTTLGITSARDEFRFGLFKEDGVAPDTAGWLGFFASQSAGSGTGVLWVKNPNGTNFAATTYASIAGGRATSIATTVDASAQNFIDGVYDFSMTVRRYGAELTVQTSIASDVYSNAIGPVVESNPARVTFDFDRVGFLAGNNLNADQLSFVGVDVSVGAIPALTLQVDPDSGMMRMLNTTGQSLAISYYEVASATGSLDTAGWASLDSLEEGDPVGVDWDIVPASSSGLLSEVNLASTTTVANNQSLSLGAAFLVGGAQDLVFNMTLADGLRIRGVVEYVAISPVLLGDANMDGTVDIFDVAVVSNQWGTPGGGPGGDGDVNDDGVVDIFDVALISNNWGAMGALSASAPVPEPTSLVLGACAGVLLSRRAFQGKRRRPSESR